MGTPAPGRGGRGPDRKKREVQVEMLNRRRQSEEGAWSYLGDAEGKHGDTSQTQYVVLALWTAQKQGLIVETEKVAAACNWLLRTQDITGSWGYHGDDPGSFTRKDQMNKPGGSKSNTPDAASDAAC